MSAHGFLEDSVPPSDARYTLVPVPYEKTTTYRKGTAAGPAAILAASYQVETFDIETGRRPGDAGIHVTAPVTHDGMPDALARDVADVVGTHMDAGRIVGCLGGEHSISLGPLAAVAARHREFGILQIDAHPDLRDSYAGTKFGHGCVMRRALDHEQVSDIVAVGLRAVSEEDKECIRADRRVHAHYAFDLARRPDWIERVVDELPESIYITVDVDGLDPSVVPGTGTPEPGGLSWWDTLALLRAACERRQVLGFDVVELLPEPPSAVSDFATAKLVFKILCYLTPDE